MARDIPFLHIITRTYKRPGLLLLNQKSLAMQTGKDFYQQVIEDKDGKGTAAANVRLRGVKARGRYVWVFDDDNVIMVADFLYELGLLVAREDPDVVVVSANYPSIIILPSIWPPELGKVDAINLIVRGEVWDATRENWGDRHAGDFDWIKSLDLEKLKVSFLPGVPLAIPRVSRGLSEQDYAAGKRAVSIGEISLGRKVRILHSVAGADFSYPPEHEVIANERNIGHLSSLVFAKLAELVSEKE